MKKLIKVLSWILYSAVALFISSCYLVQTPYAKKRISSHICAWAEGKGYPLAIEKIEGLLPFSWTVHGVSLQLPEGETVSAEKLQIRISALSLFKHEIALTYGRVEGGLFESIPFSGGAMGKIRLDGKKTIKVSRCSIESAGLYAKGEGRLTWDGKIKGGSLSFCCADLTSFAGNHAAGMLGGYAQLNKRSFEMELFGRDLVIEGQCLAPTTLLMNAERKRRIWKGSAMLEGGQIDIAMTGHSGFRFDPDTRVLSLDSIAIDGPAFTVFGKVDLSESLQRFEGTLLAHFEDLSTLRPIAPDSFLKGRFGAKIDLQSYGHFQDLSCQVEVEDFSAYDAECQTLTIESNIFDLFGDLRGEFSVEGKNLSYHQFEVKDLEVNSNFEPHSSPLSFAVSGNWKEPFAMKGSGQWQKRGTGAFINLIDFQGLAFQKVVDLKEPFSMEWDKDHFKMSNLNLDVGNGHLTSRIDLSETTSLIKLNGEDFPLDFLAIPSEHLSLKGVADFSVDLVAWENKIQGSCGVALKRGQIISMGEERPLTSKGTLQIHLSNKTAQVHGELKGENDQYLQFCGSLPIAYQHYPLKVEIAKDRSLFGEMTAQGQLQDIFDFINIGAHRLEGWVGGKLYVSKTIDSPSFQGQFEMHDGLYENYYTGTFLKNIEATARATHKTIYVTDLSADDAKGGKVHATGSLLIDSEKEFPFSVDATLHNFATVSFDTITGKFNGRVNISGNSQGAMAQGKLELASATMRIPDDLPANLPILPITFVNPPDIVQKRGIPSPDVSPLLLDLDIDVPGKAKVEGRGLNAELKGNLHLTGTYTDMAAEGTLELVNGEFIFSGKVFDLRQGELIFQCDPEPSAYISLDGECVLPDVTVTALLRGPLTSPKLNFQSSPQLPISSILAQILFNKDISEISAVQALQVAQTVISLSGNSAPDILEKIRKSLGIDRLTLVTSENDPGKISLQIGKYLMKGVLLTLSGGAESRNVNVDVELIKGVKFQAEMNEDFQGKLSLKWHHHY